ncbi:MAG: hypothetical protein RLZZ232_819 [Planctomycetota bacterium]
MNASLRFLRCQAIRVCCEFVVRNSGHLALVMGAALLTSSGHLALAQSATAPSAVSPSDLRQLINRELAPPQGIIIPTASDAEFLRRVSLDLTGMPPRADDARRFLTDPDPARREKLVDQLLATPEHARHLASALDVMLMERRANTHVSQDDWMAWLLQSVRSNKPWNVLVRELLTADGENAASRPAARFLLDRGTEPNVVARDVGRLFFGRDMQCAQCHDSPIVSDFLQKDYQGLLAVSSATYPVVKKIDGKDVTVLADRAGTDLTFESVFSKGTPHRTGARLPGGTTLAESFLVPGDEYQVAPADGVRSVPKQSRRQWLAETATSGNHRLFNENAANRFWSLMFGRGLVHPLDMLHPDNPAVSPALLQQLGAWLATSNYDLRTFLREVALSEPYQRPFDLPVETQRQLAQVRQEADSLAAIRVSLDATLTQVRQQHDEIEAAFQAAETALIPVAAEQDKVRGQTTEARKKLDEATKAANDAVAALNGKKSLAESLTEAYAAAAKAGQSLSDDPAIVAAAQVLKAKSDAITGELPALQQAVTDKTGAVTAPNDAFRASVAALEAAQSGTLPLSDALLKEEARLVVARAAVQDAQLQVTSLDNRLAGLQRLAGVADKLVAVDQAAQLVASRQADVIAATQAMTDAQAALNTATETRQGMLKQRDLSQRALDSEIQQRERLGLVAEHLNQSRQALDSAVEGLTIDNGLKQLVVALQDRQQASQAALDVQKQAVASAQLQLDEAEKQLSAAINDEAVANTALKQQQELMAAADQTFQQARMHHRELQTELLTASDAVPNDLASRFALSQLKPLTPEQLCWTVFRVTTVYDRYRAGEIAELDKASPLTDEQKQDPAAVMAREQLVEQRTWDKLKGNLGQYVAIYGGAPGQPQGDFYASADQALFTANGSAINSWVAPAGDNPAERILKTADNRVAAEELYLGILTRMPSEDEIAEVSAFLSQRPDRNKAAQELVWGLLSSAEFRFNR